MNNKIEQNWWNFATGKYDLRTTPTGDALRDYIPQDEISQRLFDLYQDVDGVTPLVAMTRVLNIWASGKPAPDVERGVR